MDFSGFPFQSGLSSVLATQPVRDCKVILRRLEELFCVVTVFIFGVRRIATNSLTVTEYFYLYLFLKAMSAANEQKHRRTLLRNASVVASNPAPNSQGAKDGNQPSSAQPQVAQLQISDQQREINARTAQGKLLYDALSPAKKIELDRILQSVDLKRADIPEIFGHLTVTSTVKERGKPGIYH